MPITDWEPTLDRVGALLRTRTKDTNGNELGTFTAATKPTDAEAQELLDQAVADLAAVIGEDIPAGAFTQAEGIAAIAGACLIELSFFPEQINTGRSPYNQLKDMYDDRLKTLVKLIQVSGGTTPNEPGVPMAPVASFPPPAVAGYCGVSEGLQIGYGTRW